MSLHRADWILLVVNNWKPIAIVFAIAISLGWLLLHR